MKKTALPQARRGFSLPELLLVISLLAPFALIAGRLFVATFKTSRDSAAAIEATTRFDSAIAMLRADVWAATRIESSSASTVSVNGVTWTSEPSALRRTSGSETRTWPVGGRATFSVRGPVVTVRIADASGQGDQTALVSQVLIGKERER